MELDKILSGKTIVRLDDQVWTIDQPSREVRHKAEIFAQESFDRAFLEGSFLLDELIELGGWSEEEEFNLTKKFPENLDQMKLDYYKRFYNEQAKNEIKKHIIRLDRKITELLLKKNELYHFSCEHIRENAYLSYIIESSVEANVELLVQLYQKEQLDQEEIRKISKSSSWRIIWMSSTEKASIFGVSAGDLTKQQLDLISYSRMYDNVYQSMECPTEEIIEDDYALDGWFVEQRIKRKDENAKKTGDKLAEKTGGNEVFVPVGNKKESQKVSDMNSSYGKGVIKSITKDLSKSSEVDDLKLSHVKQTIGMESSKQQFKGKR